jgi:membrane protein implicated in regulation of membrane protease activity
METPFLTWWMWLIAGVVLLAIEILTPGGFFIIFFGCGAVVVGLLLLAGLPMSTAVQGLVFLAFSVVSLKLFRKPVLERFQASMPSGKVDSMEGETAVALEDIPSGGYGKAELRGSAWNAHNASDQAIARQQRVRVVKVDGLTLQVRA